MVGAADATTGQAIIAFVTLKAEFTPDESHGEDLRNHVADKIGKFGRPKTIVFTDDLPKTRSGKIMRRLLKDVAEGRDLGRHHDPGRRRRGGGDQAPGDGHPDRGIAIAAIEDDPGAAGRAAFTVPEYWRWRAGPVAPGRAVVFDVDGVLSDAAGRQHFLEGRHRNWDGFFDACGDDPLIDEVAQVLALLAPDLHIVLLTGRPLVSSPRPWPGWSATSCAGTC